MWSKTNVKESKLKSLTMPLTWVSPFYSFYIVCSTHSLYMLLKVMIWIRKELFNCSRVFLKKDNF